MNQDRDDSPSTDTAVKSGRAVFYFVGGTMAAVPIALAFGGIVMDKVIEWLVIGTGISFMILGAVLPRKIVANCGFNLPAFLPNLPDDD